MAAGDTLNFKYIPNPPTYVNVNGVPYQYQSSSGTPQGIDFPNGYDNRYVCEFPGWMGPIMTSEYVASLPDSVTVSPIPVDATKYTPDPAGCNYTNWSGVIPGKDNYGCKYYDYWTNKEGGNYHWDGVAIRRARLECVTGNHARPTNSATPGYVDTVFRYWELILYSQFTNDGAYQRRLWRGWCNSVTGTYQRLEGILVPTVTVN